jgi:hypothetical protein
MTGHEMTLTYTIHDDGTWLVCKCSYRTNLGFNPSPDEAAGAGVQHCNEIIEAAAAARQCWNDSDHGRSHAVPCETRADWEATGPDGTTRKSCDRHLAGICDWGGVTSVRMLADALV